MLDQRSHVPFSRLCTFKHHGYAPLVYTCSSIDLAEIRQLRRDYPALQIIGRGSNSLIHPDCPPLALLRLSDPSSLLTHQHNLLTVGAGHPLSQVLRYCQQHSLSGLAFGAGVPAGLGGMIAMNFGCWGHDIASRVQWVEAMDASGIVHRLSASDCQFGYRSSRFLSSPWIILRAALALQPCASHQVRDESRDYLHRRQTKQPVQSLSFGSVFTNPPHAHAGHLLDVAGLKGKHLSHIQFSDQHANFMINNGDGCYHEVMSLICLAQTTVYAQSGIWLAPEVQCLFHV